MALESMTFDTSTPEGLKQAERYQQRLCKKFDKVIVVPIGLYTLRICGFNSKPKNNSK
jgi:hypothetical protein